MEHLFLDGPLAGSRRSRRPRALAGLLELGEHRLDGHPVGVVEDREGLPPGFDGHRDHAVQGLQGATHGGGAAPSRDAVEHELGGELAEGGGDGERGRLRGLRAGGGQGEKGDEEEGSHGWIAGRPKPPGVSGQEPRWTGS